MPEYRDRDGFSRRHATGQPFAVWARMDPTALPAIVAVGWGVAMGNAEPEVVEAARLRVADVDDDGAAEAIDRSATLG